MSRNIVFIVLDTVRKDYFDEYATRISRESDTSFEQCRAVSSWSVPSHASMFSGQLPHQHNVHSESFDHSFDFYDNLEGGTFIDDLQEYNTFGVSSNIYINAEFGVNSFFDEFVDHSIGDHYSAVPFPEALTDFPTDADTRLGNHIQGLRKSISSDSPLKNMCNGMWLSFNDYIEMLPIPRVGDNGAKSNAKSIQDFISRSSEPFFVFANFMDAHNPLQNTRVYDQTLHSVSNSWSSNKYDKWELLIEGCDDSEYIQNYRDLYGTSIDYLDRIISRLIPDIMGESDGETTIVITADHGHNLGFESEKGYFHHTGSLSEGVLHVPLEIINPPSDWPSEVQEKIPLSNIPILIELIKNEEWDEGIVEDTVVAERIGLLGEDSDVNYDGQQEVDSQFWNRMIRCGYESHEKFEWDSVGNSKKYNLDDGRPCSQSMKDQGCAIPGSILSVFDEDIKEYKSKWENRSQDLTFNSETKQSLKDLGYL